MEQIKIWGHNRFAAAINNQPPPQNEIQASVLGSTWNFQDIKFHTLDAPGRAVLEIREARVDNGLVTEWSKGKFGQIVEYEYEGVIVVSYELFYMDLYGLIGTIIKR